MVIVGFCIVPHGAIILPDEKENTDKLCVELHNAMKKVTNSIKKSKPDLILLSTPHGISLQHNFGVYLNETGKGTSEWLGEYHDYEVDINIDSVVSVKLLTYLKAKNYSVEGITAFSPSASIKLRWGEVVPLHFIVKEVDVKYIIISHPTRRYSNAVNMIPELEAIGNSIYSYFSRMEERIFVVISGDLAHTFQEHGPYGYNPDAELFDGNIASWITYSDKIFLFDNASSLLISAKSCGFTGFVLLQGMLNNINYKPELLCIGHPTYYGMVVANFTIVHK